MTEETTGPGSAPEPARDTAPRTESSALPADRPDSSPRPVTDSGATSIAPDGVAGSVGGTDDPETSGPPGPGGAPRPRRRGSRGGKNRRKPGTGPGSGGASEGPSGNDDNVDDDSVESSGSDSDSDAARPQPARSARPGPGTEVPRGEPRRNARAAADRGFTAEDVGAEAREEAGLVEPSPNEVVRPKIGDSRPAPPVAAPGETSAGTSERGASTRSAGPDDPDASPSGPKKRRRRGGRNRSRSGSGGGAASSTGGANATSGRPNNGPRTPNRVVTSQISDDDNSVLDDLDEETLERRRGKTRKGRPTGRYQMIVHVGDDRTIQMGVLEGRVLTEHYVSRPEDGATSIDGNIYLGKVQNVLPGMEAAFVDIGTPKNGVIYQRDVQFEAGEMDGAGGAPKIETALKNGQSILVQVTKNPIGAKGARLTQDVSLAGRFVVMVPNQPTTYGISKRLPDDERKRLRKVLEGIRPTDAGLIVRTAAEGATADELTRDLARLQDQWRQISSLAAQSKAGTLLYREPPLVVRVIREEFTKEYRSIVIDDDQLFTEVKAYVDAIAPELSERIERYEDESLPIFERFHIHEQLHKALDRKVWLPSGGSLIIERTEALTVVDVNTGKNVGKSNLEETVFANNLEAANEIARQLRLRDIGGIIVIDFIDMEIKKNRDAVTKGLREALARDKTRTQVFEISDLGLVEMTRKRISEGLVEAFSETCAVCGGRGFVVDEAML